jgi:hypothetical protein
LKYYSNIKREISRIYFARFSKLEVREIYSDLFGTELKNEKDVILSGVIVQL